MIDIVREIRKVDSKPLPVHANAGRPVLVENGVSRNTGMMAEKSLTNQSRSKYHWRLLWYHPQHIRALARYRNLLK